MLFFNKSQDLCHVFTQVILFLILSLFGDQKHLRVVNKQKTEKLRKGASTFSGIRLKDLNVVQSLFRQQDKQIQKYETMSKIQNTKQRSEPWKQT